VRAQLIGRRTPAKSQTSVVVTPTSGGQANFVAAPRNSLRTARPYLRPILIRLSVFPVILQANLRRGFKTSRARLRLLWAGRIRHLLRDVLGTSSAMR